MSTATADLQLGDTLVVAHFSTAKGFSFALGWLAFLSLLFFLVLHHPADVSLRQYLDSKGLFRFPMALIGLLGGGFLALRMLLVLRQLIFRKRAAVWIRNDKVFYVDTYGFGLVPAISLNEILSVSVGKFGTANLQSVAVASQRGTTNIISWLLVEAPEVVAARLNQIRRNGRSS